MHAPRRPLIVLGLLSLCLATSGCSKVWHNLQPYRLHQLNRGPGMETGAEAYSCLGKTAPRIG